MHTYIHTHRVGDNVDDLREVRGNKLLKARIDSIHNGRLDLIHQLLLSRKHCGEWVRVSRQRMEWYSMVLWLNSKYNL